MSGQGDVVWSIDGEHFSWDDLADILSNGDHVPGDFIYRGTATRPTPSQFVDADDVIEQMGCQAYDIAGEYAESYPDVSKEAKAELQALLEVWAEKNCPVNFYSVHDSADYEITEQDFIDAGLEIPQPEPPKS